MLKKNNMFELTLSEFGKRYPLVTNQINCFACFEINGSAGCLFETYGEELAFVRNQDPRTIWTLVDAEGDEYLLSGFHFVNRLGYLVSTVPFPENIDILVRISSFDSDENESQGEQTVAEDNQRPGLWLSWKSTKSN